MWQFKFETMGNATEDEIVVILEQFAYDGWELVSYDFATKKGLFRRRNAGVSVC